MILRRFILPALAVAVAAMAWLGGVRPAGAFSVERVVSDQGIEAWLVQDHSNPILAVNFSFRGGSATDPAGKAGLADMATSLLDEGAGDLDSQAFQRELEDLAVSLGYSTAPDAVYGHVKTLSANRARAFELLTLSLTRPRFDGEAVERVRGQQLAQLASRLRDPNVIAGRAFAHDVFPDHPYGRPLDGDPDSIKAITADDLKAWVPAHFGRDRLTVGVVGDITPDQLKPLLDQAFAGLPEHLPPIGVPEVRITAPGGVEVIHRPIPQSVVLFGEQGVKRDDPDWYAAYVMNYVLGGGGFSSRLMTEVRVKRGLAYGVHTLLAPHDHAGLIEGSVATRNDKVAESLALIRQQWAEMAAKGVTAEELADAKRYLTGSFPLQMDSTASIASLLVTIQMDHLGIDYLDRRDGLINGVSAEDVRRVAGRLLDPARLTVVVVGEPQGM